MPADNKWFTRLAVAGIMARTLEDLTLRFPAFDDARREELIKARERLVAEK